MFLDATGVITHVCVCIYIRTYYINFIAFFTFVPPNTHMHTVENIISKGMLTLHTCTSQGDEYSTSTCVLLFLDYHYCYYYNKKNTIMMRCASILYQFRINILSSNIYNQKMFFFVRTRDRRHNHYHFIDSHHLH